MFAECKNYLLQKLQAAGMKDPCTTMKALSLSKDSHVSAVIADKETFERNGSKKIYTDDGGSRHKRRKLLDRAMGFDVIIGDYTDAKAETTFETFLASLDDGLYVNGNYVTIDIGEAEWAAKDDSILQSKLAVNVRITFNGGVYRDTDFAKVADADVEAEKGNTNGSQ